jgi:hypothetical protein
MATATLDDITHNVSHDVTPASSTTLSILPSGFASQNTRPRFLGSVVFGTPV